MSALTAHSTIADWLRTPPVDRSSAASSPSWAPRSQLTPVSGLPLQQLVAMSQGQLPQSLVDDLVLAANGGVVPDDDAPQGVARSLTTGRFAGKTVIVTGAASGIGKATALRVAKEGGRVIAADISKESSTPWWPRLPDADLVTVPGDTHEETHRRCRRRRRRKGSTPSPTSPASTTTSPRSMRPTDATWERVFRINVTAPQADPRRAAADG